MLRHRVMIHIQQWLDGLQDSYRVYYAREGETVVLLLCGGSKRSQAADIKEAARYWLDYRRRRQ